MTACVQWSNIPFQPADDTTLEVQEAPQNSVLRWKVGFYQNKVPVRAAVDELVRLHNVNGSLTAKDVVDASRPEDAPLHPVFEWDDSVASEQWRQHQARLMVCAIEYTPLPTAPVEPIRYFVHVREDDANPKENPSIPGYTQTEIILNDEAFRKRYLRQIMREAEPLIKKCRSFEELADLVKEYEATLERLAA